MGRRDASFTFLHRVDEVEWNIEDGRWQSALALALTLPDICGGDEKTNGNQKPWLTVLSMPIRPDELRRAVSDCITKGGQ